MGGSARIAAGAGRVVTLRIGLIGCGRWGRHILRDLIGLGASVHVMAPSEATRAAAHAAGAVQAVDRIDELGLLDGYVIATPSVTHADVIAALVPTGRPIFVEKPMTTDAAAARRILAAAGERVFVMDKWRYHAGIEALAGVARAGELGRVLAIRTWRLGWGNPHQDTDAIWVLLPHDLSIALEILGYLPAAHAAFTLGRERSACDFVGVLRDGDGPQVTMEIGASHPVNRRSVLVIGSERCAQLGGSYDDQLIIADGAPHGAYGKPYERAVADAGMPLLAELRAFLDHVRGGPAPRSSAAEGALIVERIAALRALAGLAA